MPYSPKQTAKQFGIEREWRAITKRLMVSLLTLLLFLGHAPQSLAEPTSDCPAADSQAGKAQAADDQAGDSQQSSLPASSVQEEPGPMQWKMHELSLNSAQEYDNAYTDISVTAHFSGPAGQEMNVNGFWDGGDNFLVRFTPPTPGHWSYAITSVPSDLGLTQSGSFTVTAATKEETGFVRRDPQYPTSFVYDNGERYFMMGTTYYEIVRTACGDQSAEPSWQVAVANVKQFGINKIRMLVHPWGAPGSQEAPGFYSKADFYPTVLPFVDNDHDRLNHAYWQQLDNVVAHLEFQGIVADLLLFTNSELAFGTREQDERYLRYVLARYAAFPNVIWCLSNEWEYTQKGPAYWDRMGKIVRSEDPWMAQGEAYRALSVHNQTGGRKGGKFSYFESEWPVHAIVQYGVRNAQFKHGDQWGNYSIVQNRGHNMPVVNDEYGYIGETRTISVIRTVHRNALWGTIIGGGYAAAGDGRFFNDGPNGEEGRILMTAHWHAAEEYEDIKHLVDFWTSNDIPYWMMAPDNGRIEDGERVYLLASDVVEAIEAEDIEADDKEAEGNQRKEIASEEEDSEVTNSEDTGTEDAGTQAAINEYVIYAASGGDFTLPLPDDTYRVQRFDPRNGKFSAQPSVTGGDAVSFSLPDGRDWVLHIRQQPAQ